MIDFKTFESLVSPDKDPVNSAIYTQGGGMLRKTPVVKKYDKIGFGKSQVSETGVYALEPFVDNEVIEQCPVIQLSKDDVVETPMMDYVFKVNDKLYALALGYGSLYNHRNQPNARWHWDDTKQMIVIRAARAIKPGEEIFISYGKDYFKTRDISMKGELNNTNTSGSK